MPLDTVAMVLVLVSISVTVNATVLIMSADWSLKLAIFSVVCLNSLNFASPRFLNNQNDEKWIVFNKSFRDLLDDFNRKLKEREDEMLESLAKVQIGIEGWISHFQKYIL